MAKKVSQAALKRMSPEKRRAYEREKRRVARNRSILALFLCVVLIVGTGLFLSLTVFFKIDTIIVKGQTQYSSTQIINASGITKGKNLILCDAQKASDGICRNLPYISKAEIKKTFPSSVIIETVPAKAYIAVKTKSGTALADKTGKIIEIISKDKIPDGVVKLESASEFIGNVGDNIFELNSGEKAKDNQKTMTETLQTLLNAVEKCKVKDITSIDIKSETDIHIMYQNRLNLNIGTTNDIEYKLKAAVQIIEKEDKKAPGEKGDVYLSDTGNMYVSPENK